MSRVSKRHNILLNAISDLRIDVVQISSTVPPILVVDNVYKDPNSVRSLALGLDYARVSNHPGDQATVNFKIDEWRNLIYRVYVSRYFQGLSLDDFNAIDAQVWTFSCMFREGHQLKDHMCKPHVDPVFLSGTIYLNDRHDGRGGTGFFQHRKTGLYGVVAVDLESGELMNCNVLKRLDEVYHVFDGVKKNIKFSEWKSPEALSQYVLHESPICQRDYLDGSSDDWLLCQTIETKFNRMVLFPGLMFHSPIMKREWFGSRKEDVRLTQNLFFEWPKSETYLHHIGKLLFGSGETTGESK